MTTTSSTLERRNFGLLVAVQSLGGASPPIIISLRPGGADAVEHAIAATLPVSLYQLGLALSTLPAAWLMHRAGGARPTCWGGDGMLSVRWPPGASASPDFMLFRLGTTLAGFMAPAQSYRFAAIDAGRPRHGMPAPFRVMVGGLIAAVIGPQVVIWTRDSLPMTPFAGSFYSQAALALLALPLLLLLRLPPALQRPGGPLARATCPRSCARRSSSSPPRRAWSATG